MEIEDWVDSQSFLNLLGEAGWVGLGLVAGTGEEAAGCFRAVAVDIGARRGRGPPIPSLLVTTANMEVMTRVGGAIVRFNQFDTEDSIVRTHTCTGDATDLTTARVGA